MKKDELISAVDSARRGNKAAFETLYNEYYDKVYFFVLKNVGNKEAAEDITQETFLQSMENISRLEKPEFYGSWLHSIANHKCTDLYRREKRTARFDTEEDQQLAFDEAGLNEPMELPEDYASNKDTARALKRMIDELKPDMRSAVILYYYDNMSISEVASSLGMSDNAAKQKLFQARKKLKSMIDKMYGKNAVFCSAPIGSMLRHAITPKYAASARVVTGAAVNSGLAAKIAGVSAAAILVIGLPIAIKSASNASFGGNARITEEVSMTVTQRAEETVLPTTSNTETTTTQATTTTTKTKKNSAETTPAQVTTVNEYIADTSAPEIIIPTESTSQENNAPNENVPAENPSASAQSVEMSVDKMLTMDAAQLRALSNDEYEIVSPASSQAAYFGFKCKSFPDYVFVVAPSEYIGANEEPSDPNAPVTGVYQSDDGGRKYVLGNNRITQLDLYGNAYIGDGVNVGMRYNEIEQILGTELYIQPIESSMNHAAIVNIDGRQWYLHFDLTDEQYAQFMAEIESNYRYITDENGNTYLDGSSVWGHKADFSDVNPVCDFAVYMVR